MGLPNTVPSVNFCTGDLRCDQHSLVYSDYAARIFLCLVIQFYLATQLFVLFVLFLFFLFVFNPSSPFPQSLRLEPLAVANFCFF